MGKYSAQAKNTGHSQRSTEAHLDLDGTHRTRKAAACRYLRTLWLTREHFSPPHSSTERPAPTREERETTMDACDGFSPTKNVDRLLVMPHGYPTRKTTQNGQKQKRGVTGEPDTWKLVSPVRRGGVEKGHFMYLVGVLLYHLAHEKREDGRHSPAEVLGWVTGKQFEPDYLYRAFSAICEIRTLTKAGYARFRDFLFYGERGLAGKKALLNIFQDTLALEYGEQPLAKYSVEWQPDDKHLLRVGNPRLYEHPNPRPQLDLWPPQAVEWFMILKAAPYGQRPRHKRVARILVMQPPLLTDGIQR